MPLAVFVLASPCAAQPENYPNRPVRLIVPFAPGGPTDTVARVMGEQLQRQWKQPVVIDYKPGAGTVVGTQLVARAPADGYTLGMAISALMINPALRSDLPYDTVREVAAVSLVGQAHFGLFAHPSTPFSSVAELIAYARSRPDALSYATPGTGTGTHLAGEMLSHLAGIKMLHVPYKGSAPAQVDVAGGRVPLLFDVLFSAMPMVRDGRLKVLALASPQRARSAPEIALIAETLPGFSAMSLIGIIGPAGMPTALLDRISADLGEAVRAPAVTERMNQLGMEPVGSTHAEYSRIVREEIGKWTQVVKTAQIKLD
jgi:tripartite-type tricarboxylate transporter receptor subunit TctC